MWTPYEKFPHSPISKTTRVPESPRKCTKIYPCYIVLTDLGHLIGRSLSASCRFLRGLKNTECTNMCKKMYFRRRLKAGKNVFNVKTPSFIEKRMKYLEKLEANKGKPTKVKSDFTKMKMDVEANSDFMKANVPQDETHKSDRKVYPNMFINKGKVEYSFDESSERKTRHSNLKSKVIVPEKETLKQEVKLENDEIKLRAEQEKLRLKAEDQEEKEKLRRIKELRKQQSVLLEQIKIKRAENFHKKAMRKSKQKLPYFKLSVSSRSGRVIKPNSFLADSDYALNSADIIGYKKLNILHEKQRKVLAAMKQENKAKRVQRTVLKRTMNLEKLDDTFIDVLGTNELGEPEKAASLELEIDNPESIEGVRKIKMERMKPKKPKLKRSNKERDTPETSKKKSKKLSATDTGDGVIISTLPNTENVMKLLQADNMRSTQTDLSSVTGADTASEAYPYARSILNASKDPAKKVEHLAIKPGFMLLDPKKKFKDTGKDVIATNVGGKLMFFTPITPKEQKTLSDAQLKKKAYLQESLDKGTPVDLPYPSTVQLSNTQETSVESKPFTTTTCSSLAAVSSLGAIPSIGTQAKSDNATGFNTLKQMPISAPVTPNLVQLPFPFVSVPITSTSLINCKDSQPGNIRPVTSKPTLVVNPAYRSCLNTGQLVISTNSVSLLPKPLLSMNSNYTYGGGLSSVPNQAKIVVIVSTNTVLSSAGGNSVFATAPISTNVNDIDLTSSAMSPTPISSTTSKQLETRTTTMLTSPKVIVMPKTSTVTDGLKSTTCGPQVVDFKPSVTLTEVTGVPDVLKASVCRTLKNRGAAAKRQVSTAKSQVTTGKPQGTAVLSTATGQLGNTDAQRKGKFYLMKVDGKHILIPVPGSVPGVTLEQKAYLVNDLSSPSLIARTNPLQTVTPLPTQTVDISSKPTSSESVKNLIPSGTAAPIMSYIVKSDGSVISKMPSSSVPVPSSQTVQLSPGTVTSSAFTSPALASSIVSPVLSSPVQNSSSPACKFIFTPVSTPVVTSVLSPVPSISVKPTIQDKQEQVDHPIKKTVEEIDKDKHDSPQKKDTLADTGEETEKHSEVTIPTEEKPKAKPFAEAVTDREERLRRLRELLKQKNEAVEQVRQTLNKSSSTLDGSEI